MRFIDLVVPTHFTLKKDGTGFFQLGAGLYAVSVQPGQIFRKKVLVERTLQCYKNQEEEHA
jgi:hypothetical protein